MSGRKGGPLCLPISICVISSYICQTSTDKQATTSYFLKTSVSDFKVTNECMNISKLERLSGPKIHSH